MSSNTWWVFHKTTGVFTGAAVSGSPADAERHEAHVGPAFGLHAGNVDPARQRLDVPSGALVPYQPPQPQSTVWADHVWDASSSTWLSQPTNAALAFEARVKRAELLATCDKTQLPDYPLNPTQRAAWLAYRAALRSVPEQPGFPTQINWPASPSTL